MRPLTLAAGAAPARYSLSKVKAEKLAWEMSRKGGCPWELCVLNPCLIWGPMLPGQPHLNTSTAAFAGYMDGSRTKVENACKAVVDVRDIAAAHIAAAVTGKGWGKRFLIMGGSPHWTEVCEIMRDCLPDGAQKDAVPSVVDDVLGPTVLGAPPPNPVLYDVSPSEELLGLEYHSVRDMVSTSVESMVQNGLTSGKDYKPEEM